MIIFNSPNNPTGTVLATRPSRNRKTCRKHDLWVLSDEIYARILFGGEYQSISTLPSMADRTVIIDGFSKSFAMTGWRLGYAVAPVRVIDAMDLLVLNTFTCTAEFTQVAAIEALRDSTNAVEAMVEEYRKRRDQFVAGLARIPGFRCQAPDGRSTWVNIEDTGLSAEELKLLLEEAGVAGVPGGVWRAAKLFAFLARERAKFLEEALERISASPCWRAAVSRIRPPFFWRSPARLAILR
jgi:aspartate/methionine/tyrosine aminotransferase